MKKLDSSPPQELSMPAGSKSLARQQTTERLELAMHNLSVSGSKLSITAVAKAAKVTPALIHNSYPNIAERIRAAAGTDAKMRLSKKDDALKKEKEQCRMLRALVEQQRLEIAKLSSHNQALVIELSLHKGVSAGKVVSILKGKDLS